MLLQMADFHDMGLQGSTFIRVVIKKLSINHHWSVALLGYRCVATNQEVGQE